MSISVRIWIPVGLIVFVGLLTLWLMSKSGAFTQYS
jgi:hypothetical protein